MNQTLPTKDYLRENYILDEIEIQDTLDEIEKLNKNKILLKDKINDISNVWKDKNDFLLDGDKDKIYSSILSKNYNLKGVAFISTFEAIKLNQDLILSKIENKDILKSMLKIESKEELTSGDIWINIEHENFKNGLFVQVEAQELGNGNYSNDRFNLFAYENFLNKNNELETNYDKPIFKFEFNKLDIEKLDNLIPENYDVLNDIKSEMNNKPQDNLIPENYDVLNDIKSEMKNKPQAQELHLDKKEESNIRRNK